MCQSGILKLKGTHFSTEIDETASTKLILNWRKREIQMRQ